MAALAREVRMKALLVVAKGMCGILGAILLGGGLVAVVLIAPLEEGPSSLLVALIPVALGLVALCGFLAVDRQIRIMDGRPVDNYGRRAAVTVAICLGIVAAVLLLVKV